MNALMTEPGCAFEHCTFDGAWCRFQHNGFGVFVLALCRKHEKHVGTLVPALRRQFHDSPHVRNRRERTNWLLNRLREQSVNVDLFLKIPTK